MPWSVKEIDGNYCVVAKDTGKTVKCHGKDKAAAEAQVKALYANMPPEEKKMMMERGYQLEFGTTLVAIAATNKPHLRQRGADISLVERNGKKMVRVPVAKKGVYRHKLAPDGKLVLDDNSFAAMIGNFDSKVTDFNMHLDLRHKDEEGSLALLDKDDGGELVVENDWLVSYGFPTDEKAENLISTKRYRYASAEIHPNYNSNLIHQLSTDDLSIYEIEGENMTDKTISLEEYNSLQESKVRLSTVEQELADLKAKQAPPAEVIPDSVRLKLEAMEKRVRDSERAVLGANVARTVSEMRSYRNAQGQGHTEAFIKTVETLLLGDALGEGEETIKLESDSPTSEEVATYYRKGIMKLANLTQPVVQMESRTQPDDQRLESNGNVKMTLEEIDTWAKSAWPNYKPEEN